MWPATNIFASNLLTDLSWHPHISNIHAKTRRIIELLYRRFYRDTSPAALLKLCLSYIRPHLEYSATVWNLYLKQDIDTIENVQKFALRVCLKSWDCSYDQLLVESSLPSMQQKRNFSNLCHLYKIYMYHGMTHFPDAPFEQHTSIYNTRSTDSVTFKLPKVRTNGYKFSFFPRTTNSGTLYPQNCRTPVMMLMIKSMLSIYSWGTCWNTCIDWWHFIFFSLSEIIMTIPCNTGLKKTLKM